MRTITVGSRRSALAMTQTNGIIARLKALDLPYEWAVKQVVTKGDRILNVTLSKVGGKGLFVKEIEKEMLEGTIDLAVHSMKDMPAEMAEGLVIGAVPERIDPRDVLVTKNGKPLEDLPKGAVIGTSSLRRGAQMKAFRPDFEIKWIRGNIETRLRKLREEDYDAIILAAAGLDRMDMQEANMFRLPVELCLPAVGQGALAVQCRAEDEEMLEVLRRINDVETERTVAAERAFLHKLEGGCQVPVAGYCQMTDKNGEPVLELEGLVASPDGKTVLRDKKTGTDPLDLGVSLAEELLAKGADRILNEVREGQ